MEYRGVVCVISAFVALCSCQGFADFPMLPPSSSERTFLYLVPPVGEPRLTSDTACTVNNKLGRETRLVISVQYFDCVRECNWKIKVYISGCLQREFCCEPDYSHTNHNVVVEASDFTNIDVVYIVHTNIHSDSNGSRLKVLVHGYTCLGVYNHMPETRAFGGVEQLGVLSEEDCKLLCGNDEKCLGFDFDSNPNVAILCYLHYNASTFAAKVLRAGFKHYILISRSCDQESAQYVETTPAPICVDTYTSTFQRGFSGVEVINSRTLIDCYTECNKKADCESFDYDPDASRGKCFLFNEKEVVLYPSAGQYANIKHYTRNRCSELTTVEPQMITTCGLDPWSLLYRTEQECPSPPTPLSPTTTTTAPTTTAQINTTIVYSTRPVALPTTTTDSQTTTQADPNQHSSSIDTYSNKSAVIGGAAAAVVLVLINVVVCAVCFSRKGKIIICQKVEMTSSDKTAATNHTAHAGNSDIPRKSTIESADPGPIYYEITDGAQDQATGKARNETGMTGPQEHENWRTSANAQYENPTFIPAQPQSLPYTSLM